jgi:hypothetical protein
MSNFSFNCPYCAPAETLISVTCPAGVSEIEWRRHWKSVELRPTCSCCGCVIRVACDGQPAETGGCVNITNISPPRIDSLSVVSGARTGGEALYVYGSALDVGSLVIKFDGVPVRAVTNRSATQARIVTPIGRYYFQNAVNLHKITLNSKAGAFSLNDIVWFDNRSSGVIRHIEASTLWIHLLALTSPASAIAGQVVHAPHGSGRVESVVAASFLPGESVRGLTSGSRGAIIEPLGVTAPSAHFVADEIIRGDASGSCAVLGTPAHSGRVSVTVENEYGLRSVGGTLVGGFTYL